ncbi:MAG: hypothetical protein HYS21_08290 [Deltaproteobacteria bacterium]|nr:hypothetical protein [Deltaproteobacteria bacterium]
MIKNISKWCIAIFYFFISSTTLFAESAWVLWSKKEITNLKTFEKSLNWQIHEAFEGKNECENQKCEDYEIASNIFKKDNKLIEEVGKTPYDSYIVLFKDGHMLSENFYCLPATIDPREPS